MGVSCNVLLPANVRARDFAMVLARIAGFPGEYVKFKGSKGGYARVEGVELKPSFESDPAHLNVTFDGRSAYFTFEPDEDGRGVGFKSTSFWVAVATRLVHFFGGKADFSDCDDVDWDLVVAPKSRQMNCPTNGGDWESFQRRVLAVEPLSLDEIAARNGAYPNGDDGYVYSFDAGWRLVAGGSKEPAFTGSLPEAIAARSKLEAA